MKISKFNTFIKENAKDKLAYLDYFQILIDKYGEDIGFKDSDGDINIALNFVNSNSDNIDTILNGLNETIDFFKDIKHIRDNMDMDGISYEFSTKDFSSCRFRIELYDRGIIRMSDIKNLIKDKVELVDEGDELRFYKRTKIGHKESLYGFGDEFSFTKDAYMPNISLVLAITEDYDRLYINDTIDAIFKILSDSIIDDKFDLKIVAIKSSNSIENYQAIEIKRK